MIMRVYIRQTKEHSLFEQAAAGFYKLGYEIIRYSHTAPLELYTKGDIFVGSIEDVHAACGFLGLPKPFQINYPAELRSYMHRHIHIGSVTELPLDYPFFVKPAYDKTFSARIVRGFSDLIGIHDVELLYTQNILDIVTEYRCYVLGKDLIGVKHYKGDPFTSLDKDVVNTMITSYTSSPNTYSMDIGRLPTGEHVLVEVNNGYSTGNYGLSDMHYATFLKQSWLDICNT